MRASAILVLLSFFVCTSSAQNSADAVFDRMIAAFEENVQGVNDYTVVSDAFTSYHRRVPHSGGSKFEAATTSTLGGMGLGNMTTRFSTDNPRAMKELYGQASTLIGQDSFDGASVHVLRVDASAFPGDEADMEEMKLYVDSANWMLLGMRVMSRKSGGEGLTEIVMHFEDYRDDDGLLFPYRTRVVMPNPDVDIDDEQVERAREALAQIQERMASMPAAQRTAMETMMASQIERMEKLAAGGDLETIYQVTELRVNTGVDAALFNN
jgi:outer membrane lipoprotein-sorting protein